MLKKDEIANPTSCFNKARDDQVIFVLLDSDDAFAATVRFWAGERLRIGKNRLEDAKIQGALEDASAGSINRTLSTIPFLSDEDLKKIRDSADGEIASMPKCNHEYDAMMICRHCNRRRSDILATEPRAFDGTYPNPSKTAGRKENPPPGSQG